MNGYMTMVKGVNIVERKDMNNFIKTMEEEFDRLTDKDYVNPDGSINHNATRFWKPPNTVWNWITNIYTPALLKETNKYNFKYPPALLNVAGYENEYGITPDGGVYSFKTGKFLKIQKGTYKWVWFFNNGKRSDTNRSQQLIHKLLAIAFIPNPENKPHVNHIDGDKYNNSLDNLEWVTAKEDRIHARDTGLTGDFVVIQYDREGRYMREFISQNEAARQLGISQACISRSVRGETRTGGGYIWKKK